jgi:hypothetical protein
VEASADFMVLRPRRPPARGSTALLEVSNRGGKALLPYFTRAAWSLDPTRGDDLGDGLLTRLSLTLIWIGWQFDVPREPGLLRLHAPVARADGRAIEGLVRSDWTIERPTTTLSLAHRDHIGYPVIDPLHPDNVLTVRSARLGPREIVPRERWRFARQDGDRVVDDPTHVYLASGFQPGRLYELVYRAQDPVVVGIGLAAVRDIVSWARYEPRAEFPVTTALAFGVSQSGRFLRHFLYQGFNTDEAGRKVFDGMLIHTAGAGRGSFNHRFAQPSRDAHRFSAFFYPTDIFPFTTRVQTDPVTGATDGLLGPGAGPPEHRPKIFFTNTGYEYWGRAASLIHTSVDGRADVPPLPTERVYHLAGGQHFVGGFPPRSSARAGAAFRDNPLDFLPTMRALLVRLLGWVVDDRVPPPSAVPTLADGTLVPLDAVRLPKIPDLRLPTVIHQAHRVDYGAQWGGGVITREPPAVGAAFPALVSQDLDVSRAARVVAAGTGRPRLGGCAAGTRRVRTFRRHAAVARPQRRHAADRPGTGGQGHPDDSDRVCAAGLEHPLAEREPARRLPAARSQRRGRALQGVRQALDNRRLVVDEPGVTEPPHLGDDREQRLTLGGQLVLHARRRLREAAPLDDPFVLEDAQPL